MLQSKEHTAKEGTVKLRRSRLNRGESLVEVMVAILISGLAILMMATVIAAATNINETSRRSMDDYYAKNNAIVEQANPSSPAGDGHLTLYWDEDTSLGVKVSSENVNYYIDEQVSGTAIISYEAKE